MNNKTLGIIAIVFGSLVLYSEQEYAWIISAVFIGIGTGIWFWKDKKNDTDKINLVLLKRIGHPIINQKYNKKGLESFLKKELMN